MRRPQRAQHVALWAGNTGDTFADRPDLGLVRIITDAVLAAAAAACQLSPAPHGCRELPGLAHE